MKLTAVQEKANNINFSTCVTASAGTGKTALLAERYISCLEKDKECDPSKILCLTFTDKATAEIREKIGNRLQEKRDEEIAKGNSGKRYSDILEMFPQCKISTFHGFCSSLLREFALDTSIHPGFTIMDEIETSELTDDTISTFLTKPPSQFYQDLVNLYLYSGTGEVTRNTKVLVEKWRILEQWYHKFLENPEDTYNRWIQEYRQYILSSRNELIQDERICAFIAMCKASDFSEKSPIKKLIPLFQNLQSADSIREIITIGQNLNSLNTTPSSIAKFKHTTELPPSELSHFRKSVKLLDVPIILDYNDEKIQFLMQTLLTYCKLAEEIHRRIEERKRRKGLVTFDDLIDATKKLMENEDAVSKLRNRFRYILVDEVQDNDPALTSIVTTLAGDLETEHKLFIVGDIKQSIYKFRGADPDGALDFFKAFSTRYELDICFRSLKPIVDKVNKVFTKVFPPESTGITYAGIDYDRKGTHGSVQIIRNESTGKVSSNTNDYSSEDSRNEATMVASWIHRVVTNEEVEVETETKHPAHYGDIVILLDRRTRISALTEALDTFGVPYREYKGRSFYTSQEIIDITNVLRAIVYQEDDIALYGALVSPYFGISAEMLSHFKKENKYDGRYLSQRLTEGTLQSVLEELEYYRTLLQNEPFSVFLHHLVEKSGITSIYAAENDGDGKLANLAKYLDIASQKSSQYPLSPYEFLNYIQTSITREVKEEEGNPSEEGDDADVVKIMTVHASKGLQFPVVILMFSGRGMRPEKDTVYVDNNLGPGISSIQAADGISIPSYPYLLIKQKTANDIIEERKRIFYVAATRARDHLIISETESNGTHIPTSYMEYYRMGVAEDEDEYADTTIETAERQVQTVHPEVTWNPIIPVKPVRQEIDTDTARILQSGSCMHEIFEGGNAEEVCMRYGMPDRAEEFAKDYEKFMSSWLMKDVVDSKCELEIITGKGEYRRLDRLVKKSNGTYLIIDYKEGKQTEQKSELIEEYKKKLIEYAEAAGQILHRKIPAYLYFVGDASTLEVV